MDCSLREASHKELSSAPKNASFGPIGTTKRAKIRDIRVLLVFHKWLDFCASQRMVFSVFFEALYFGHCLSFYIMRLEPPKHVVLTI